MATANVTIREQLAWAAGIIDGEGSWSINKQYHRTKDGIQRIYYRPALKVSQTAKYGRIPEMLLRLQEIFPVAHLNGPYQKPSRKHAEYYDWGTSKIEFVQFILTQLWTWMGNQKRRDAKKMWETYLNNRIEYLPYGGDRGPKSGSRKNWPRNAAGRFVSHG